MTKKEAIKIFEERKVRTIWDDEQEKWYFSIVDVIEILTEQPSHQGARNYWKVLKNRLIKEGNQTVTNCNRLKFQAEDGKMRLTTQWSNIYAWAIPRVGLTNASKASKSGKN